jgi:uridine phosphorylase
MHIQRGPGDVAPAVLLPGDPGRVARMATQLSNVRQVATSREFTTVTGTTDGIPVTITSTGVGAPSTSIAVEELWNLGARLFIRVGTCGGIQDSTRSGDLVIATGAVRGDGTSVEYVDVSFPAVADPDVTVALRDEAIAVGETPTSASSARTTRSTSSRCWRAAASAAGCSRGATQACSRSRTKRRRCS